GAATRGSLAPRGPFDGTYTGRPYAHLLRGLTHAAGSADRLGRRRLAHPRSPARSGRAPEPLGVDRAGGTSRRGLGAPHPFVVALAVVLDRCCPGGSRLVRHTGVEGGEPSPVPGLLLSDPVA